MAKARPIPGLDGSDSMGLGAARIVRVRTDELDAHSRDVLDVADIERVHDMRVTTRRLRAALEVFAPCFPKKARRAALGGGGGRGAGGGGGG
ncbi:MAG: CHAD domain-containing protein, partial [Solirubrobacterales bacterium]